MNNNNPTNIREEKLPGYSDKIKSKEITSFSYIHPQFRVECEINEKSQLHVVAFGGNIVERDGTAFSLNYFSKDQKILNELQTVVKECNISYNNGYILENKEQMNNAGDTIRIQYRSGEEIYKSSNQFHTISNTAIYKIYELFHQNAIENGFDFNTVKSNVKIYDDATEEYLQGRWIANYPGMQYIVDFIGNSIKIFFNGTLTDDKEYFIIRGSVRQEKKKMNVDIPSSEFDFEEFDGILSFRKKDNNTLIGYLPNNMAIELQKQ